MALERYPPSLFAAFAVFPPLLLGSEDVQEVKHGTCFWFSRPKTRVSRGRSFRRLSSFEMVQLQLGCPLVQKEKWRYSDLSSKGIAGPRVFLQAIRNGKGRMGLAISSSSEMVRWQSEGGVERTVCMNTRLPCAPTSTSNTRGSSTSLVYCLLVITRDHWQTE